MQFPENIQSGSGSNKVFGKLQMQKLRALTFTYLQRNNKKKFSMFCNSVINVTITEVTQISVLHL